jgi:hypothetical protein
VWARRADGHLCFETEALLLGELLIIHNGSYLAHYFELKVS